MINLLNTKIDTSELISNLIREKLKLKKLLNQKDLIISDLNKKLNKYEREVNYGRK